MSTLSTNKKKVRGWNTQFKRVRRWKNAYLTPDWKHFERTGKDYAKLYLDPWYRLTRRTPPARLRWDMIEALLDVHEAWAQAAQQRAAQSEETELQNAGVAYLAIWLFWPDFMNSQVVMADANAGLTYQQMFGRAAQPRPLPDLLGRASRIQDRLVQLPWLEHVHEEPIETESYEQAPLTWQKRHPASSYPALNGQEFKLVELGRVWVAQTIIQPSQST